MKIWFKGELIEDLEDKIPEGYELLKDEDVIGEKDFTLYEGKIVIKCNGWDWKNRTIKYTKENMSQFWDRPFNGHSKIIGIVRKI